MGKLKCPKCGMTETCRCYTGTTNVSESTKTAGCATDIDYLDWLEKYWAYRYRDSTVGKTFSLKMEGVSGLSAREIIQKIRLWEL